MRYVGNIDEDGVCRVKIAEVDGNDPLFKVKNGENALAFYSHYYQPLPLVLRGYGAGNDVTAAGVFADLLRTPLMEVRSLTWLKFMPRLPVPI
ncbi:bifunctional aspartokinase I/homoserine dehydrogenase I [Escherichia coli]|uniref:Bifunctional aspartokinase I/homoserine dehydrogenase I n=1 Tax=Escherichia coli TaxID=562 RepID=A0A377DYI6_ECOLX|nr:bifunctional aspartokinase I/homoserine dehydrogenase I [Escherichia coli]